MYGRVADNVTEYNKITRRKFFGSLENSCRGHGLMVRLKSVMRNCKWLHPSQHCFLWSLESQWGVYSLFDDVNGHETAREVCETWRAAVVFVTQVELRTETHDSGRFRTEFDRGTSKNVRKCVSFEKNASAPGCAKFPKPGATWRTRVFLHNCWTDWESPWATGWCLPLVSWGTKESFKSSHTQRKQRFLKSKNCQFVMRHYLASSRLLQ